MPEEVTRVHIKELARECGFELAGVAAAEPSPDAERYQSWVARGLAGEMGYLTDRRAGVRNDPRLLLPSAKSIICVGKLYNGPQPYSTQFTPDELGWISRYAWGGDYHEVLRRGLKRLAKRLGPEHEYKICVDTAPLLERSYARAAGLGWIGKNTCLINQPAGSWFFLGELLTSLAIQPDSPSPDRCGTCRRCIEACPTQAISPDGYELDARLCISYFTIELRGAVAEEQRSRTGNHVFGCDICQDVCPPSVIPHLKTRGERRRWTAEVRHIMAGGQPPTRDAQDGPQEKESSSEQPHTSHVDLLWLLALTHDDYAETFRGTSIKRAKDWMLRRNAAIALGNVGDHSAVPALARSLRHDDNPIVRGHAAWALGRLYERLDAAVAKDLCAALETERDEQVRQEIALALQRGDADTVRHAVGTATIH